MKRIIKLDPGVKNIGKEATAALARATELFVSFLALKAKEATVARGVRAIRDADLAHCIHTNTCLEFLRLDFPKRNAFVNVPAQAIHKGSYKMKTGPTLNSTSMTSFFRTTDKPVGDKAVSAPSQSIVACSSTSEDVLPATAKHCDNVESIDQVDIHKMESQG